MGMNPPKSVLVTGSEGFIGKQLVQTLRTREYEVHGFDRPEGDISSEVLHFPQTDHVIHLASMVYVPQSWEDPFPFYKTNVLGTVNILEHCRKTGSKLIYVSSYMYGAPRYLPIDELHPVEAASPYNHSKYLAEEACRFYADTFKIPIVIIRPVNIYGPGQNNEFLIPTIINQVFDPEIEKIKVMDLRPRRDYLFISDFVEALIRCFPVKGFHIYNIGSGTSVSVGDIISTILKHAGISKEITSSGKERTNEIWDMYIDFRKFSEATGWKPEISFEEGIEKCIAGKQS
jgi:nucleoside-diphosphate-sugar epimerase